MQFFKRFKINTDFLTTDPSNWDDDENAPEKLGWDWGGLGKNFRLGNYFIQAIFFQYNLTLSKFIK